MIENLARFLRGIADRRQPETSSAPESAEHVENDPGLLGLTEVQPATDNEIEQIVRRVTSIKRRFEVIARDEKFFLSVRRGEGCAFRSRRDPPVKNCRVRNGCVVPPLRRLISIAYVSQLRFCLRG